MEQKRLCDMTGYLWVVFLSCMRIFLSGLSFSDKLGFVHSGVLLFWQGRILQKERFQSDGLLKYSALWIIARSGFT